MTGTVYAINTDGTFEVGAALLQELIAAAEGQGLSSSSFVGSGSRERLGGHLGRRQAHALTTQTRDGGG